MSGEPTKRITSMPGVRRLPFYLNLLRCLHAEGGEIVSAITLAEASGHPAPVVKKDIEITGAAGKTGVGYEIGDLIEKLEDFIGWKNPQDAILVGVGHLGCVLLGHDNLNLRGLNFVAAFDSDPERADRMCQDVKVFHISKMPGLIKQLRIKTAVITVPAAEAQAAADLLVEAGIRLIWSFAPTLLNVPDSVTVQREDLSAGLAELLVKSRLNESMG